MKKILTILLIIVFIVPVCATAAFAGACPLAATEQPAASQEVPVPAPSQASPSAAPNTGDVSIIISLAVLIVTAFVTIKLTRQKNRTKI